MTYQKSPLPYLLLLAVIIGIAVYSTNTVDQQINRPLVYTIDTIMPNKVMATTLSTTHTINRAAFITYSPR